MQAVHAGVYYHANILPSLPSLMLVYDHYSNTGSGSQL